jgi:hypothetical protein
MSAGFFRSSGDGGGGGAGAGGVEEGGSLASHTALVRNPPPFTPPTPTTIYGEVYTQGLAIGLASYHFVSETECYISYSMAPLIGWRLDDGTLFPEKKDFSHCKYDPATLTFTGDVVWTPARPDGTLPLLHSQSVLAARERRVCGCRSFIGNHLSSRCGGRARVRTSITPCLAATTFVPFGC